MISFLAVREFRHGDSNQSERLFEEKVTTYYSFLSKLTHMSLVLSKNFIPVPDTFLPEAQSLS